jgi:hypothetical protein
VARVAALPPPIAPYPPRGAPGLSTDDPLTAYRKANVYPPTSRPLTRDQHDLLRPTSATRRCRPTITATASSTCSPPIATS